MEDIFISNIHINKVRHLENVDILLSETERKHLILTGRNGSGKTSVLEEIKKFFALEYDPAKPLKIFLDITNTIKLHKKYHQWGFYIRIFSCNSQ